MLHFANKNKFLRLLTEIVLGYQSSYTILVTIYETTRPMVDFATFWAKSIKKIVLFISERMDNANLIDKWEGCLWHKIQKFDWF